jgi:plasmid replication initiation protein
LKSNLFKGQITIELEELKNMTGAKEKAYSIYNNVKSKVLMQAQKELSNKTDISFEFEELKTGRKVTALKFYIHSPKTYNKWRFVNSSATLLQQMLDKVFSSRDIFGDGYSVGGLHDPNVPVLPSKNLCT